MIAAVSDTLKQPSLLVGAVRDRREFLRIAAVAAKVGVAGAVLTACGGTNAPVASAPASTKPASGASGASAASSVPGQAATARALNVAYLTTSAPQAALWMADAIGAFKNHNVNVNMRFVSA